MWGLSGDSGQTLTAHMHQPSTQWPSCKRGMSTNIPITKYLCEFNNISPNVSIVSIWMPLQKYLTKINDRSIWDFHVAVCRKIADISPKSRCSSGSSGRMFSSACICTKNQWPSAAKPFGRGHFSWVKPEQSWLTNESNMPTPFVEKHTNTHSHVCYVCFFGKHSTKKLKKL